MTNVNTVIIPNSVFKVLFKIKEKEWKMNILRPDGE